MIPKHKDTVIGGIVLRAITQEIGQRPRRAHIRIFHLLKFMQAVRIVEIEIEWSRKRIVLPCLRAARENQYTHIRRQIRFHQLLQICTRRTVLRLEIRAADIPRDEPCIIPAIGIGELRTRLRHILIRAARKNECKKQRAKDRPQHTHRSRHDS